MSDRLARLVLIKKFDTGCIAAGLRLLPVTMDTREARAQMLKIGLQESQLIHPDQLEANGRNTVLGPALGFFQFERGAVVLLMRHIATKDRLRSLCRTRGVPYTADHIWRRLRDDDVFAAAVCRLNLWWHSAPIPPVNACWDSWSYYIDCWNPGKPKPETWPGYHEEVVAYFTTKA